MPGRVQAETTALVASLLGSAPRKHVFPWLLNKHTARSCGLHLETIDAIFLALGGFREGLSRKGEVRRNPDAFFGPPHNFMLEVDELLHFTPYKAQALACYPRDAALGFDLCEYVDLCAKHGKEAMRRRRPGFSAAKKEFPFENGRHAQRAYLDSFRDLLPPLHGLRPTLRIPVLGPSPSRSDVEARVRSYLAEWAVDCA